MKKLFTILFVILLFSGSNSFAQGGNKFGHVDFAKLYSIKQQTFLFFLLLPHALLPFYVRNGALL